MMRNRAIQLTAVAAIACGVAAGGTYAAVASLGHSDSASTGIAPTDLNVAPPHGVNARGQSYGSAANATSEKDAPNLIAVVATNGRLGYVLKSQLDAAPTTLQQVENLPQDGNGYHTPAQDISVYETDGVTVVGAFHIG